MQEISNSSFYGFYDPDGRPWGKSGERLSQYQDALESSLKIAFLTQSYLPIPAGYFLDNLAIQRIFDKYSGRGKEARYFRELVKHCILVAVNESSVSESEIRDWNSIWNEWATGRSSNRNQFVYLNCLPHEISSTIQVSKSEDDFKEAAQQSMLANTGVHLPNYLQMLDSIQFRSMKLGKFCFDQLLSEKYISGLESFSGIGEELRVKLAGISQKTTEANIRISRSVIASEGLCLELGVDRKDILTRAEYEKIAPVLGHYHHYAFAHASGLPTFVAGISPVKPSVQEKLVSGVKRLGKKLSSENGEILCFPLEAISFEDIYRVRLGKKDEVFRDNLQELHDSISRPKDELFIEATKKHYKHIQKITTHSAYKQSISELEAGLNGTLFVEEQATIGLASFLKGSYTFFREFLPNIEKRTQIKTFFRSIEPIDNTIQQISNSGID